MMEYEIFNECMPGEKKCGDSFVIEQWDGFFLAAVIDGLGHGERAFQAASEALNCIKRNKEDELKIIIEKCHNSLRSTVGGALSILKADYLNKKISFAGVGNVRFKLHANICPFHPIPDPGIVGYRIRKISLFEQPLCNKDLFCMFSDGITSRFDIKDYASKSLEEIIKHIEIYIKKNDDATLFVARYYED